MKRIRVRVFLGPLSLVIDNWHENWIKGKSNDPYPYGYNYGQDQDVEIEYINNSWISKVVRNRKLQLILCYLMLPFQLFKCDVVWTHYDKDALLIGFLKKFHLLRRFMPKQISCFVWLADDSKHYGYMKSKIVTWLLTAVDRIIVHSPTEIPIFIDKFRCKPNQVRFVPFGINPESYYSGEKKEIDDINYPFILSVGNDKHRDIEKFINIAKKLPNLNFVYATNNKLYEEMLSGIENIKVVNANLEEMRWLYDKCLFVILPLKYNEHVSGCTTVLEAGACKKVVVVSDVPGMSQYVINNETGFLVDLDKDEKFLEIIEKLQKDIKIREKIGGKAYRHVLDNFTTIKWAKEHTNITRELI
ncbi:glycosyltransferase [Anoxybacillus flavithermus]|uniref:glycosyltransferase n=1 Tax=Anoxybacillus flavithermus TaxID=33934 RepID=UPI0018684F68|nr:glycosyltransferase family 4 protein [Anoxybacillus flavithermus]